MVIHLSIYVAPSPPLSIEGIGFLPPERPNRPTSVLPAGS